MANTYMYFFLKRGCCVLYEELKSKRHKATALWMVKRISYKRSEHVNTANFKRDEHWVEYGVVFFTFPDNQQTIMNLSMYMMYTDTA